MDMKNSRRLVFPPGRPAKEEATLDVRIDMWKEVFGKFIEDNYKEGGCRSVTS